MIVVTLYKVGTLSVRCPYALKETIKALATWPDVRWDKASHAWLIDARLFDKLVDWCGADFAPLDPALLDNIPMPEVLPARKGRK